MLIVRYTGKTDPRCMNSSDTSSLVKGQLYEVRRLTTCGGLHIYELSGMDGSNFHSDLFTIVGNSDAESNRFTELWVKKAGKLERLI